MSTFKNGRIARALARKARLTRALVTVALAGFSVVACDVHGISDPGDLSAIVVTPNPQILAVNGTQQFTAVGTDFSGATVTFTPTWSVTAGGGTISATGLFTAGTTPGTFASTVKATSGSLSATATVLVTPGPLATIVVTPNPMSMSVGTTQQFLAVGKDASGNIVQFTPTWSVVAGGGAVSGTGLFTAGTVAGTYTNTIQASAGSLTGTATVTVTPGPLASITVTPNPTTLNVTTTRQFTAVGKDASGNVVGISPVWSVVNGGGAIGIAGLFTAGTTPGTYSGTVQAASGAISGTATVEVTPGTLATITVTPNPATLAINGTRQFIAVGRDVGGNIVPISPTWAVVAGGGSVDLSTGLFTAGSTTGTFTNSVRASVGSLAGFATVIVTGGSLATITVTPSPVSVQTNGTQQFIAVGRDGGGNVFVINPVWSVESGGGSINPSTGMFTAGATAGTFNSTVKATSGSVSGFATVTVTAIAPSLESIVVSPDPVSVQVNGTQYFSAVGRDGSGNIFPISPVWSVVNSGGTINDSTGLFIAGAVTGTFDGTVVATSGAISGDATVTVTATPPALASITVTPDPASVQVNATREFSAVGRDELGNIFPISPVWSVVNSGGTINDSTGVFTAGGTAGTFTKTVVATSGAFSDTATVIVTALPPSLATITVTPDPASVAVGATRQFAAIGRDENGDIFPVSVVWSVVNAAAGTINDSTGVFTAGSTAGTFTNAVVATSGLIADSATVTVTSEFLFVDLKTATPLGILAATEVTCSTDGLINADVTVYPGTGFTPGSCTFNGLKTLGVPPGAQQQVDMLSAFNTLAGLPCPAANVVAEIGGTTKFATDAVNVYCTAGAVLGVTGDLTLDGLGNENAVFVFQSPASSMVTAGRVLLQNGAKAKNVYWVIGTSATLGVASQIQGNILANISITLVDGATLVGRALAHTGAVTMGANNVINKP